MHRPAQVAAQLAPFGHSDMLAIPLLAARGKPEPTRTPPTPTRRPARHRIGACHPAGGVPQPRAAACSDPSLGIQVVALRHNRACANGPWHATSRAKKGWGGIRPGALLVLRSGARKWARAACFVNVRPAWARSWRCKSSRELATASEGKHNCARATERGEEVWNVNRESRNTNRI